MTRRHPHLWQPTPAVCGLPPPARRRSGRGWLGWFAWSPRFCATSDDGRTRPRRHLPRPGGPDAGQPHRDGRPFPRTRTYSFVGRSRAATIVAPRPIVIPGWRR